MQFINSRLESNGDGTYNMVYFDDDDGITIEQIQNAQIDLANRNNIKREG